MTEQTETTPAPVRALIEAAGIKRIVYVDDAFSAGVDDLVGLMASFSPEQRSELLGLEVEEMAQEDLWQKRVRERWESEGTDGRASLVDAAYAMEGGVSGPSSGFLAVLGELVPEVEHEGLTLAEWRERSGKLIAELAEKPTLLLFDQDFSHENGKADEGQKLISELETELAGHPSAPEVFYGLVTNTVAAGEEPARRNQIIEESGVDPMRFVLISKQNLDGEHERLALRLRTMLLAPTFAQLMQAVSSAVAESGEDAVKRARKMTADDLDHMVVRSSAEEGVWPADTMLRILEVMQQSKVREALRLESRVVELTERLRTMGELGRESLQSVGTSGGEGDSEAERAPAAVEIAHDEIYESAEHVNALHLPIALGDIFERGDGKRYVVVAQPCDLEVRSEGERAPELSHVMLAKVSAGGEAEKRGFAEFELPYFERGSSGSAFVELNRPSTVRAAVLDACVFNPEGEARLELDGEPPSLLLPYWRLRLRVLGKTLGSALGNVGKIRANASQATENAVLGSFKGDPFKVIELDPAEKKIEWDCKRVGRVCDPYARALLARFSQYYARDAYLHDIGGSAENDVVAAEPTETPAGE